MKKSDGAQVDIGIVPKFVEAQWNSVEIGELGGLGKARRNLEEQEGNWWSWTKTCGDGSSEAELLGRKYASNELSVRLDAK